MTTAEQIVAYLLENEGPVDPKDFIDQRGIQVNPKITTSYSKVRWHDDADGDPNAYDEEHGFEDEEGEEIEVDEFDREDGMDVERALGAALDRVVRFARRDSTLELFDSAGLVARFRSR